MSPRPKFGALHDRRMGTLSFVPIPESECKRRLNTPRNISTLKQNLQVGPRAEAQELIGEDAGRTVANTESSIR